MASSLWVLLGSGIAGILLAAAKKLKKTIREDLGAFIEKLLLLPPPPPAPPKAPHPLTALSFAISDLLDVSGYVTGFGHPDWVRTHEPASSTCPVVSSLVEGGATCVGKTVVDELAFSISGETKHYESPTNPAAHDRIPGGSCSGAAVAVATNAVDFALGELSRFLFSLVRTVWFKIDLSFGNETWLIRWFARDPNTLRRVGLVLLHLPFATQRNPRQIILADDYFQLLKIPVDRITQVVIKSAEKLFGRQLLKHQNLENYFESNVPSLKEFARTKDIASAKVPTSRLLANVMQLLQRHEFLQNHEDWINTVKPAIDPVISSQLSENPVLTNEEVENLNAIRNQTRAAINSLLKIISEDYQNRASSLHSIASISGCCQVTVPLGHHEKCPVSVSSIARHGGDRFLLDTVQTMYASLQENSSVNADPKSSKKTISQEESAEIAKEKGNQAFKAKQWQKAIGLYSEAIKLSDSNGTYYSNRAAAYLEIGSFLQAEEDCTKAITLDKKNVKAYLRRGTAREMLSAYKEAMDDFKHALVLEPNNKRASLSAERLRKLFQSKRVHAEESQQKIVETDQYIEMTTTGPARTSSLMDDLLGLLRIRIKRGVNLAVRDINSSDPYVVVKMGKQVIYVVTIIEYSISISINIQINVYCVQKLKTRVVNKDVNPEWNEDLTLSVTDPSLTVLLTVYDHDIFSKDDKMGDAEFEIKPYIDALRMHLDGLPSGTIVTTVQPCRRNCLSEESKVTWIDGKLVQDLVLRLRHVECGEVEAQLQWIDLPGSKGL
ncbi:hypothetical protein Bca52824_018974 [Brassica carinata]|uniref:C2 domain-containing protein n=1 Tax=Brassica carinata TaxID=52824 RepID=A0A8X8AZY8_BRACI|nr:hypothetical protein Bca52824_018974 [Brassica carinata]